MGIMTRHTIGFGDREVGVGFQNFLLLHIVAFLTDLLWAFHKLVAVF